MSVLEIASLMIMTHMSYIDMKKRRVPIVDIIMLGLLGCGELFLVENGTALSLVWSLLPGMGCIVLAWLTKQIGYGDGLCISCIGVLYGLEQCLAILAISLMLSFAFAIGLLLLRKGDRTTQIPFLPFLEGGLIVWKIVGFISLG